MKYEIEFVDNPKFASITGLTNTTFDPDNIQEDRMASEAQVLAAWNASVDLEQEVERCCKNMAVWETYVQVVRLYKNTINNRLPNTGGVVVSPFQHNRRAGIIRHGETYTVTFSMPFNNNIYVPYTIVASANGGVYGSTTTNEQLNLRHIQYRITVDDVIARSVADESLNTNLKRDGFLKFVSFSNAAFTNDGYIINSLGNWGAFVSSIADDGTVSITDARRIDGFTVIRYYTQWTLRECSDGSILADPT